MATNEILVAETIAAADEFAKLRAQEAATPVALALKVLIEILEHEGAVPAGTRKQVAGVLMNASSVMAANSENAGKEHANLAALLLAGSE